jgi:hypothetical protein
VSRIRHGKPRAHLSFTPFLFFVLSIFQGKSGECGEKERKERKERKNIPQRKLKRRKKYIERKDDKTTTGSWGLQLPQV